MTPQEKKKVFNTVAFIVSSLIILLIAITIFNSGMPWIGLAVVVVPLTILFYKKFGPQRSKVFRIKIVFS